MRKLWASYLVCLTALAPMVPAWADAVPQPRHAIAMLGEPLYPANFTHLDYVNPNAPKGGTLVEAAIGTFDNLNPFILSADPPDAHLFLAHDRLMTQTWNEPYTLYGLVAETATIPDDRSWIEFAINPKARFSDGTPITADDLIFSFETLKKWGRANTRRVFERVAQVIRVDDSHVRFVLGPQHDRETVMIIAIMRVLSKHYWQGREFNRPTLEPSISSGPYRIAAIDPGRSVTYERRADYWAKDMPINVGLYNFDQIRVDFYRDDNVALEAFKAGAYDFRREVDATKWLTGYDFPAIKDGRAVREEVAQRRVEAMRGLIFNTRRPLFADRKVREALTYALDFEWMNQTLFGKAFRRIESYYPNSELAASGQPSPGELAMLEPYRGQVPPEVFGPAFKAPQTDGSGDLSLRVNLRKAMALLHEAGWVVRDGVLVDAKTGKPFVFEILLNDPHDERVALAYARVLKRLGINAAVRTLDLAQYVGRRSQFEFDMILDKWTSTLSAGVEQMIYWGSQAADTRGSFNYAGIKSPAIDAMASGIANSTTRAEQRDRVHALDRLLSWGYYAIPLYYLDSDHLAYWRPVCRPSATPIWGYVIESWYADPKGCTASAAAQ